jgi:hypothetical protein
MLSGLSSVQGQTVDSNVQVKSNKNENPSVTTIGTSQDPNQLDTNVVAFVNHQLASLGFPCLYNLKKDAFPALNVIYSLLQQKQVYFLH